MRLSELEARLSSLLGGALDIRVYDKAGSTSSMLREDYAPNRCILALEQTSGRGRSGKTFESYRGGMYFSISVGECIPIEKSYLLTTLCAVCAADAASSLTDGHVGIKWVNDIYVDEKKCCGILTEHISSGYIIGVGMNVMYAPAFCTPAEPMSAFGSLNVRSNDPDDVILTAAASVISSLLEGIAHRDYRTREYIDRSILTDRTVQISCGGAVRTARCVGIDEKTLGLVAEYSDGSRQTLHCGEVSIAI